ncbi:MAG: hemagglutinin repeat-containing protein, partial [Burkholderiaceae bacterium]|nr:hemagglutinin repeat-containing protein [Burkholderiaceae bacterium]
MNCVSGGGESGDVARVTTGACGTYWVSYDSYQASVSSAYVQLDSAITAFNSDLQSRSLIDWYETTITSKTIVETHVTGSKPGQVLAGGNITVAGGVNYDSIIVAGGNVSAGTGVNYATPGTRQTNEEGTMVFSHREYHGGFSDSYSRSVSAPQPIPAASVTETFNLPVLQFLPNTVPNTAPTPAGTSTPVGAATAIVPGVGASASSARSASGVGGASAPVGSGNGGGAVTVATTTTGAPPLAAGTGVTGADPRNATDADRAASLNAAPQPILPGSVIAATVRAEQSQAISTSQANFAALAATLPQLAQAVDTSQRRSPPPAVKAAGYTTVSASGPVRAPNIQLFSLNRAPSGPLVETDPAFTNWRNFISSAYFLLQLNIDPERTLKLYGDGFAEQRLIDDQILALTGRRFLTNYTSTEDEYQDLLNAGVMYARQYQLSPGVTLSAEQMATLTTDMVWLEMKSVILPDGSTVQALVPTVYLRRPVDGDLTPTGALIAGSNVTLRSPGDIANSGTVYASGDAAQGNGRLTVEGANINNSGALAGNAISITAQDTINNAGGVIQGLGDGSSAALNARDITLRTTTQTSVREIAGPNGMSTGSTTNADRIATVSADAVTLAALNDINLSGAVVKATGDLTATAGGAITTEAVATGYTLNIPLGGGGAQGRSSYYSVEATTQQLSTLQAGNNATLTAEGDASLKGTNISSGSDIAITAQNITIEATKDSLAIDQQGVNKRGFERVATSDETLAGANLTAGNNLTLSATTADINATGAQLIATNGAATAVATGSVNLQSATTEHSTAAESFDSGRGVLSSTTKASQSSSQTTQAEGSTLSGNTVAAIAGQDINVQGSSVVSDTQTTLAAGRDINITAATETQTSSSFAEERKSGLGALGGISLGSREQSTQADSTATRAAASNIGSLQGNVSITAEQTYTQVGSKVLAPTGDVSISAQTVNITEARETSTRETQQQFQQSGIAVNASGVVADAIHTADRLSEQAGKTTDGRTQALAAAALAAEASKVA